MWAITIPLKDSPQQVTLHYRGGLTAETAEKDIRDAMASGGELFELTDDYGRKLIVRLADIGAVMVTNLPVSMESMVENQLIITRANADIMMKCQADPKLKLLANSGRVPGLQIQ